MRYEEARDHLKTFRTSKDLDELERTADKVANELLKQESKEDYFAYLLDVCNLLSSIDFTDYDRQRALIQRYTEAALEQSGAIPQETEIQLLLHLQANSPGPEEETAVEGWAKRRQATVERGLRALQQLENEMKTDFNFDDLPLLNVAPPEGTPFSAGVAPEQITHPQLRAEYEAAIAENQQKAEMYIRQRKLRDLHRLFSPLMDRYLIKTYSQPPINLAELQRLLNKYLPDEDRKARLLNAIRRESTTES